jgi:hypothetical protein
VISADWAVMGRLASVAEARTQHSERVRKRCMRVLFLS